MTRASLPGDGVTGLITALTRSHRWLHAAIAGADRCGFGHGDGPVHHFHEVGA